MHAPSWLRRHDTWVIAVVVLVALAGVAGYQVWAVHASDHTQNRITQSASTCPQVNRLYSAIVKLAADDPKFTRVEVRALQAQRVNRLKRQGCKP